MSQRLLYGSVTLLFCLSLAVALEPRAYAYTDPGSALLLFQSLGAVASGVLFYFRRKIKRLFVRDSSKGIPVSTTVSRADS